MTKSAATKYTSRGDSIIYDEHQPDKSNLKLISPCNSKESFASAAATSDTNKMSCIEDNYYIDPQVIGAGLHGSVRLCFDRDTEKPYAVKSIRKRYPKVDPAREILLLQDMKHPGIIQLVDVYEDVHYMHIVTDLCTNRELFDQINEKLSNSDDGAICFTEDEAARIMHQMLTALSYIHKKDIAHRDIKPENILFDEDMNIKIIDFGLAQKHVESVDPPMSRLVGTPYYVAPEVLQSRYGKSCDLWSAGVIAYILLCGYPPFNGDSIRELYAEIRRGWCTFPFSDWSGSSREARDFIRRLLTKDPRTRMTAEQALDHPWMTRHVHNDEVANNDEPAEVSLFADLSICD